MNGAKLISIFLVNEGKAGSVLVIRLCVENEKMTSMRYWGAREDSKWKQILHGRHHCQILIYPIVFV